jgi:mycothiol system anti-sigma-R factor
MSGCEHAVEYVYQYIDDEMTVTRRARITMHLKRCGKCTDAFEFEKRLRAKIAATGKSQPPPELFDHLRALIQREQTSGDPDR